MTLPTLPHQYGCDCFECRRRDGRELPKAEIPKSYDKTIGRHGHERNSTSVSIVGYEGGEPHILIGATDEDGTAVSYLSIYEARHLIRSISMAILEATEMSPEEQAKKERLRKAAEPCQEEWLNENVGLTVKCNLTAAEHVGLSTHPFKGKQ